MLIDLRSLELAGMKPGPKASVLCASWAVVRILKPSVVGWLLTIARIASEFGLTNVCSASARALRPSIVISTTKPYLPLTTHSSPQIIYRPLQAVAIFYKLSPRVVEKAAEDSLSHIACPLPAYVANQYNFREKSEGSLHDGYE